MKDNGTKTPFHKTKARCNVTKYRRLLKKAILDMNGNLNKLDDLDDYTLAHYYYRAYRTIEGAAKAIAEFDINEYRETIRKEIIKQGKDELELDKVTDNSLLFYMSEYVTNAQVAAACVNHYR